MAVQDESTMKTSGTAVFNGNEINMRTISVDYAFSAFLGVPSLPGAGSITAIDWVGFGNPLIKVNGVMDVSVDHATNETGSNIDFYFLKDLASHPQPKIFSDPLFGSGGSAVFVQIKSFGVGWNADRTSEPGTFSNAIPYNMTLIQDSGLW